jgi:hypothetical protein
MDINMVPSSGSKHLFTSHPVSLSSKKCLPEDQLIAVNDKMGVHLCRQLWQLHIKTATDDDWLELILNVVLCLMSCLAATDMKDSIIAATTHLTDDVAERINEDKLEQWKGRVQNSMEKNNWTDLITDCMHISNHSIVGSC